MENLFTNVFKNIKFNVKLKDIYNYAIYICLSVTIYIFLPNRYINYIFSKLSDNKIYNIVILVFIISVLLRFIVGKTIKQIQEIYRKNKSENEKISAMLLKLDTIDYDSQNILLRFYDVQTKKFKKMIKILPHTPGLKLLTIMEIVNFCDYVDEMGGYLINKEQLFEIAEPYYSIMNSRKFMKQKSLFVSLITKKAENLLKNEWGIK